MIETKVAVFLNDAEHFGEASGQVLLDVQGIFVTCPNCAERYYLKIPPFTYDPEKGSIGPASILLSACGWHGYMHNGEWRGDTPCKGGKDQHVSGNKNQNNEKAEGGGD